MQVVVSGFYLSAQGRSCLRADSCLYNGESPPVVSLYIDSSDLTSYKIWCKGHVQCCIRLEWNVIMTVIYGDILDCLELYYQL